MLLKSNTNNYLLIKDDVGKSKPSVRQLPIDGHSYGYKCRPDKEGVGACKYHMSVTCIVLTNWTPHQQTFKKQTDKDFKELNRLAIKNNATTSDQ